MGHSRWQSVKDFWQILPGMLDIAGLQKHGIIPHVKLPLHDWIASLQVPFILMNSFSTSDDTKQYLNKEHADLMGEEDVELLQNKSPKVDAKTLEPISWSQNPDMEW